MREMGNYELEVVNICAILVNGVWLWKTKFHTSILRFMEKLNDQS